MNISIIGGINAINANKGIFVKGCDTNNGNIGANANIGTNIEDIGANRTNISINGINIDVGGNIMMNYNRTRDIL